MLLVFARRQWLLQGVNHPVSGRFIFGGRCRFFFPNGRYRHVFQQQVGIAIIAIAAGQGIGMAYRALVVAVHMYQRYHVAAKQALLHGANKNMAGQTVRCQLSTPVHLPVAQPGAAAFIV